MRIQESGEMYLETILQLEGELDVVRSIDVAEKMGFSKPSVSRAIKILKSDGLVEIDGQGGLALTETGREHANMIFERHKRLTSFLEKLGVSAEVAEEDACRIEHYISEETFEAFKRALGE